MIKKIEDLNYYELLEVSPQATSQEIHRAYERIRRVYEPNSVALYSLFTPEETAEIYQRIEEAYRTLVYEDNRKSYDAICEGRSELPEPPAAPVCAEISATADPARAHAAVGEPLRHAPRNRRPSSRHPQCLCRNRLRRSLSSSRSLPDLPSRCCGSRAA